MPDGLQLKRVALKRLEAAKTLSSVSDWDGAGHMLGLALECALKAACCKALRLAVYPATRNRAGDEHFRTHSFDRLLTVSGCEDIFLIGGKGEFVWSDFTSPFADAKGKGEWIEKRYEDGTFSAGSVADLIKSLENSTVGKEGIFTLLTNENRW